VSGVHPDGYGFCAVLGDHHHRRHHDRPLHSTCEPLARRTARARKPETLLGERFARGEIDENEYYKAPGRRLAYGAAFWLALAAGIQTACRASFFKNGTALLEVSARIDTVVMDKTGTLTEGESAVTDGIEEDELLGLVTEVAQESEHLLAAAVVRYAVDRGALAMTASDFLNVPSHGARARVDGRILVGDLKLMVDQGTDLPAVARADLVIAIGAGTNVVIETAESVLMHSHPLDVPIALRIGKSTLRKMRQNLGWAVGCNTIALPIAAGVFSFVGLVLSPEIAALSMSGSSFLVAMNALLLKRLCLSQPGTPEPTATEPSSLPFPSADR
jgi:cation transport ATPase